MNWKLRSAWLAAAIALVVVGTACGSTTSGGTASKGNITIAGFKFSEGSVLAELYGQALQHAGYTVKFDLNLGTREVVAPAIKTGQVDLYIGYAATDLEFYDNGAGEATGFAQDTANKLNVHLNPLGLEALTPSPAQDQNAFAVTQATAQKYNLKTLSDLAAVSSQLVMGAGPECKTRPFCLPGLQRVYGIKFKSFKTLDTDGPLTRAALAKGDIQVGLVFSSDADLNSLGLVVLDDDKRLQNADNVTPIIRKDKATDDVTAILNAISGKLTTKDLIGLNAQVELQHMDPDAATKAWLQQHNWSSPS
jgi:osmoprotectant transport system substrate-binding protein